MTIRNVTKQVKTKRFSMQKVNKSEQLQRHDFQVLLGFLLNE